MRQPVNHRQTVIARFIWVACGLALSGSMLSLSTAALYAQAKVQQCAKASRDSCIDWEKAVAYAVGQGAPAQWAKTTAQKNISATRAAELDAFRNLLQLIQGVNLDANTTVAGRSVQDQRLASQLQGRLRGVRRSETPRYFSDGSVSVRMEARLREVIPQEWRTPVGVGALQKIARSALQTTAASPLLSSTQPITGIVIDARGLGLQPALAPQVLGPQNAVLYDSSFVSEENSDNGALGYAKSLKNIRKHPRVGRNPAVIKAQAVLGNQKANVVLNQTDADAFRLLWEREEFLRQGRLLILLD